VAVFGKAYCHTLDKKESGKNGEKIGGPPHCCGSWLPSLIEAKIADVLRDSAARQNKKI
jgi:hypothetical protein